MTVAYDIESDAPIGPEAFGGTDEGSHLTAQTPAAYLVGDEEARLFAERRAAGLVPEYDYPRCLPDGSTAYDVDAGGVVLPSAKLADAPTTIPAPPPDAPALALHRFSASKRKLGRACFYGFRPDVDLPARGAADAADLGSALHEGASDDVEGLDLLEHVGADLLSADLDKIAEKWGLNERATEELRGLHHAWASWWAEFHAGKPWRSEIPFAYDTATDSARELPKAEEARTYPITATEIPGTIDLHLVEATAGETTITITILDIKTGRPPKVVDDHLDQLLHNAVCLARIYEKVHGRPTRMRVGIVHVMTDRVRPHIVDVSDFDLELAAAEMRRELPRIAGAEPAPGVHCRELFCNARAVCPATISVVEKLFPGDVGPAPGRRLPLVGDVVSADDARWLYEVIPMVKAWHEEALERVKAFADERGGISWPDGRVYAGREETTETPRLDVKGAEEALRTVLGAAADDAIERKITKTSIERGARKIAAKGKLGATKEAALEAMRAVGAVKVSRFKKYQLRKAATT